MGLIDQTQHRVKASTQALLLMAFRFLTGVLLALTLALIGEEIMDYGGISFTLVFVVVLLSFMRVARRWSWPGLLVFNLVCVLIGLLLRMYILIAPGA